MATNTVIRHIQAGIAAAKRNVPEYGTVHGTNPPQLIKPRVLSEHPNLRLRVTEKPTFKINRRTMDPQNPDREWIVAATSSVEAKAFVDAEVDRINAPFRKKAFSRKGEIT